MLLTLMYKNKVKSFDSLSDSRPLMDEASSCYYYHEQRWAARGSSVVGLTCEEEEERAVRSETGGWPSGSSGGGLPTWARVWDSPPSPPRCPPRRPWPWRSCRCASSCRGSLTPQPCLGTESRTSPPVEPAGHKHMYTYIYIYIYIFSRLCGHVILCLKRVRMGLTAHGCILYVNVVMT